MCFIMTNVPKFFFGGLRNLKLGENYIGSTKPKTNIISLTWKRRTTHPHTEARKTFWCIPKATKKWVGEKLKFPFLWGNNHGL